MQHQKLFQYLATALFCFAIIHIFLTGKLTSLAHRFKQGSVPKNFLHLFGEVEIVFGFWSAILVSLGIAFTDFNYVLNYLNGRTFTEPVFVFVIMVVCSTKPILKLAEFGIITLGKLLPINQKLSIFFSILFIGPILGSFITEPAAMTICAYLLLPRYFTTHQPKGFKYAILALLFLNVSIGGTLTPYAAPPILMVASKWNWDLSFMLNNFALKTILTLLINTSVLTFLYRNELLKTTELKSSKVIQPIPFWVSCIHILFLFLIVLTAHHAVLFVGLFLFFLGFLTATKEYQKSLQLREPLLVGFFLAGLVVLGGLQDWWLSPIISKLTTPQLFFGSIGLTAFTDNAALTYLGSLIPTLSESSQLALVSGSVLGGGLTLIANAPNPAGFGILKGAFEASGFSPLQLLKWAIPFASTGIIIFLLF